MPGTVLRFRNIKKNVVCLFQSEFRVFWREEKVSREWLARGSMGSGRVPSGLSLVLFTYGEFTIYLSYKTLYSYDYSKNML